MTCRDDLYPSATLKCLTRLWKMHTYILLWEKIKVNITDIFSSILPCKYHFNDKATSSISIINYQIQQLSFWIKVESKKQVGSLSFLRLRSTFGKIFLIRKSFLSFNITSFNRYENSVKLKIKSIFSLHFWRTSKLLQKNSLQAVDSMNPP